MIQISSLAGYGIDEGFVRSCLSAYEAGEVTVAVTGEFSSGKSCLINALVGRPELLPEGETECTPVYVELSGGAEDGLSVLKQNGKLYSESFTRESIEKYARYTKEYPDDTLALKMVLRDFPLAGRIHLIDCPGTNTIIQQHELITEQVLKKSDVVLYVLDRMAGESSLRQISEIYQRNEDMIFILTHMDNAEGTAHLSREEIEKYMVEARTVISDRLGISPNRLTIYPVGSKYAHKDPAYLKPILDGLSGIVHAADQKVLREKAKARLLEHIERTIREKERELQFLAAAGEEDQEALEKKMISAEKQLERMEQAITSPKAAQEVRTSRDETMSEIKHRMNAASGIYANRIGNKINLAPQCSAEDVTRLVSEYGQRFDEEAVSILREGILSMGRTEYAEANTRLQALAADAALPMADYLELDTPDFSDPFPSISEAADALQKQIEQYELEIIEAEQQVEQDAARAETKKAYLKKKNEELDNLRQQQAALGVYKPVYKEIHVDGGGEAGAQIGRVLGEVADIALLVWNPAGAAAGAAGTAANAAGAATNVAGTVVDTVKSAGRAAQIMDTVKDTAKTAQYVARFSSVLQGRLESTPALPAGDSGDNRSSERAKKNSALMKFSKVLDLVSLGHWGEQLGKNIGDWIKPAQDILEEDMENREEYMQNKAKLDQDIRELRQDIQADEQEIQRLTTLAEKGTRIAQMEYKRKILEQKLDAQKQMDQAIAEADEERKVKQYYCSAVSQYFSERTQQNLDTAREILQNVQTILDDAVRGAAQARIADARALLDTLSQKRSALASEINERRDYLKQFDEIRASVDEWLDAAAK